MHMVFDTSCFAIVADAPVNLPIEGTLVDLGEFKGKRVFRLVPVPTGTFVNVIDDAHARAVDGALVIATSVSYVVVIFSSAALLEVRGVFTAFKNGERTKIPEEIIFASGIIPGAQPGNELVENPPEPSEVLQSLVGD